MAAITLKLPDRTVDEIDAIAKRHAKPRATFMRELIDQGLNLDAPFPPFALVRFKDVEEAPTIWKAAAAHFQGQLFQVQGVALCSFGPMVLLQPHPCSEPFAPHYPVHRDALIAAP